MADVLVLISDQLDGGLANASKEALGIASAVADSLGVGVAAALLSSTPEAVAELGERGCSRIFASAVEPCSNGVAFFARAIQESGANVVIASRGPDVLQVIPRLAERVGGACVMQVTAVEASDGDISVTAAIYGGAARAEFRFRGTGPRIVALGTVGAEAPARVPGRTATLTKLPVEADSRVRVVRAPEMSGESRLEDARIVVSGGRGLRKGENYRLIRELAEGLGGMPGASRAIVDDAWAKPGEQVGLTGKIVTPDLYFAIGISGASQHMAGCSNARTLVAINTDPGAPIFRYAKYGIVGDCLEILPELIEQTRGLRQPV